MNSGTSSDSLYAARVALYLWKRIADLGYGTYLHAVLAVGTSILLQCAGNRGALLPFFDEVLPVLLGSEKLPDVLHHALTADPQLDTGALTSITHLTSLLIASRVEMSISCAKVLDTDSEATKGSNARRFGWNKRGLHRRIHQRHSPHGGRAWTPIYVHSGPV